MQYWGAQQMYGGCNTLEDYGERQYETMSYYNNEQPTGSQYTLNPSATPFNYPSGSSQHNNVAETPELNRNSGAIKKKQHKYNNYNNRRNDNKRYGSGRTSGGDSRNYYRDNFSQGQYDDVTRDWKSNRNNNKEKNGRNYQRNWNGYNKKDNYHEIKGNWRRNHFQNSASAKKKLDAASQRERLEQMLTQRILECLVCCEKVKNNDKIWSCEQCYLILHLNCTIEWAKSSKLENGWRCPACQHVTTTIPKAYKCYCGKILDPRPLPGVTAHSCGEVCMKKGRLCIHKCTILCHPGPCPDCNVMVNKYCGCGKTQQTIKCSSDNIITCNAICGKILNCKTHYCKKNCHQDDCEPCQEILQQKCYCGKMEREVKCSAETMGNKNFICDNKCEKLLSCGNHFCSKQCHEGECEQCPRDVDLVKTCPCGKMPLSEERKSCLDPIPCCGQVCGKRLKCGQPSQPHTCQIECHENECPLCPLTTMVRCRCGHMYKEIPCNELKTKADDARCEKKCIKKRQCGKHKCNQRCCIEIEHICPLPCNHLLNCGQHRCQLTCHNGRCPSCIETSFDELYCECGSNVIYPPIACGTKPPECNKPCSRQRQCGHDVNHTCHIGICPPCTILCKKWCYGKHEQRSAVPCHQENFSCGLLCGKLMSCGYHKCIKPCHDGKCPLPCKQPCGIKRNLCGHPCNAPCHKPPCPNKPCKQLVPITCQCGLIKSTKQCLDLIDEYRNIEMATIRDKMGDLLKEQSVDISDLNKIKRPAILKILECTEECRIFDRNRRLAIGLQIRNPDLSQKLTPRYTEFMKNWAKKDPNFCQKIHDKLTELVQLAKQSKQKSRSYSFETMNRDKRTFVHEYCEHFGCESAAYDAEPNRNVVATAFKDKSWLPSMSLLEVIQRENGQRKVPGPMLNKTSTLGKSESVALKIYNKKPSTSLDVDYFDNPP